MLGRVGTSKQEEFPLLKRFMTPGGRFNFRLVPRDRRKLIISIWSGSLVAATTPLCAGLNRPSRDLLLPVA